MKKFGVKHSIANCLFGNGLAPFRSENGLYGYIDAQGNIAIQPEFYSAGPFREGIASVGLSVSDNNDVVELGVIDTNGFVGVRQGDIYPKQNYSEFRMPTYRNGVMNTYSSISKKNTSLDLTGFGDIHLKGAELLTDFNSDDLAVNKWVDPTNGDTRLELKDLRGNIIPLHVNGRLNTLGDSVRDNIRLAMFSRAIEGSLSGFTNTLSDGVYLWEDINQQQGNYLMRFDKPKSRLVSTSGPFSDRQLSHFVDGFALMRFDDGKVYLVDKNLVKHGKEIDTNWCSPSKPLLSYQPGSINATVCAPSTNSDEMLINLYNLPSKSWVFRIPISTKQKFIDYAEGFSGLVFYYDIPLFSDVGSPPVLFAKSTKGSQKLFPPMIDATDPSDGIFCAEFAKGVHTYVTESGEYIYSYLA